MGDYVHSQALQFSKSLISCGVVEAHHFPEHTGPKLAFAVANHLYNKANPRPAAFVIWSDVVGAQESRGKRLAAWLEKHMEYAVALHETAVEVNPKTGNTIQLWVWHIEHDDFRKWYQEELANRIDTE